MNGGVEMNDRLKRLAQPLAAIMVGFVLSSTAFLAGQQNRIIQRVAYPNEPVELTVTSASGRPLRFDSSFMAGMDWLRGVTINLRNISGQPIKQAAVELTF